MKLEKINNTGKITKNMLSIKVDSIIFDINSKKNLNKNLINLQLNKINQYN